MKKTITFLCFFISIKISFAQTQDSLLQKITAEKDDNKRIDLMISSFLLLDRNLQLTLKNNQEILLHSQKNKDKIIEAIALSVFGQGFRLAGNLQKGLEYNYKAMSIAEQKGNLKVMAVIKNQLGNSYVDREDYKKAIDLYKSNIELAAVPHAANVQSWGLMNLGRVYLLQNELDSSLYYAQRAYELCLRINYKPFLALILTTLGGVHSKLGNASLAISYFGMAQQESQKLQAARYLSQAFMGMAQYYYDAGNADSGLYYAQKAIAAVQHTTFIYTMLRPAGLLKKIYKERGQFDSAFTYSEMYKTVNDSLFNTRATQQMQLITFEEDLRIQEAALEKVKAEEERKENMQYALMGLGIIVLLTLYLMLSRSFITNSKMIKLFGVVALLIVFEFLNLLLHPFLEKITHHSPILMLLALVCIAGLLAPLHHKAEKWATTRLVEKNKQIRLTAAKKTIQELEQEAGN